MQCYLWYRWCPSLTDLGFIHSPSPLLFSFFVALGKESLGLRILDSNHRLHSFAMESVVTRSIASVYLIHFFSRCSSLFGEKGTKMKLTSLVCSQKHLGKNVNWVNNCIKPFLVPSSFCALLEGKCFFSTSPLSPTQLSQHLDTFGRNVVYFPSSELVLLCFLSSAFANRARGQTLENTLVRRFSGEVRRKSQVGKQLRESEMIKKNLFFPSKREARGI